MEKNKASQDSIKILNRRSFIITAISLILSLIVSNKTFFLCKYLILVFIKKNQLKIKYL